MTVRRRPRGAAKGKRVVYAPVCDQAKSVSETAAKTLGVSEAQFVEELLLYAASTMDNEGVPSWWRRPVVVQEELAS